MNHSIIQMIAVALVTPSSTARAVDEAHAKRIARTVPPTGQLLQPIGVLADGDAYRVVWGGHRLRAYQILARDEIPAHILPPNTTAADEAKYSIIENSVQRTESYEDTLFRVEDLAVRMNCSLAKAAAAAEVKPSYLSRCKTAAKKLCPEAKALIKHHKLGISDAYLVASKAPTPGLQVQALQARLEGVSRDEVAKWLAVQEKSATGKVTPKRKLTTKHVCDGTLIRLTAPASSTCDHIAAQLKQLALQFSDHAQQPLQAVHRRFDNPSTQGADK